MKIQVKNVGKLTRSRNGVNLAPGESAMLEVTPKSFVVFNAVREFSVEKLSDDDQGEAPSTDEEGSQEETEYAVSPSVAEAFVDATVDDGLSMVQVGSLSAEDALELERDHKNRTTMISQLEELAQEQ